MKRGLIEWDRQELPPEVLAGRQVRCRNLMAERGLDGLLVHTDVWRSGQARYLVNFIPYWNQGLVLLPREGEPVLVTALSARVYPWIRETSAVATIVSGPSLSAEAADQVKKLGWKRMGIVERQGLPHGIVSGLEANLSDCELVDATDLLDALRSEADGAGLALYRKAAEIAAQGFAEVAADLPGKSGWQAASLLEWRLRRRAATDTVVLFVGTKGRWPAYPGDEPVSRGSGVLLSVEYKGHWAEIGRTLAKPDDPSLRAVRAEHASLVEATRPGVSFESLRMGVERRSNLVSPTVIAFASHRSFPLTPVDSLDAIPTGAVISIHLTGLDRNGEHWWWGEPLVVEANRVRPLLPEGRP